MGCMWPFPAEQQHSVFLSYTLWPQHRWSLECFAWIVLLPCGPQHNCLLVSIASVEQIRMLLKTVALLPQPQPHSGRQEQTCYNQAPRNSPDCKQVKLTKWSNCGITISESITWCHWAQKDLFSFTYMGKETSVTPWIIFWASKLPQNDSFHHQDLIH